eukprot:TRINITY_DN5411_c0_g1_i4.p1 TRINITY_DN5411_c0_g1~~TRINITY_DN5411_c0_g1_i4.p1  ORF type:complete len:675 (-),score=108.19 TRINITY_DN5411_c0_g1_i4:76-2100(-)
MQIYKLNRNSIIGHTNSSTGQRYSWCCKNWFWKNSGIYNPITRKIIPRESQSIRWTSSASFITDPGIGTADFFDLQNVGRFHSFSAGLLVGGRKDASEEQALAATRNILVATPGRLLDHMDRSPSFDCANLMILILDEADRILDMGFQPVIKAILQNIPKKRQTMLFSATQSQQVAHLADLSLNRPEFISVHEQAPTATPAKLRQFYSVCAEADKMNTVWHFVKTHLKSKTIVFFSTCKQVQFASKSFSKLQPGIVLRCLSGRMGQKARNLAYNDFQQRTQVVLFCTDIAARGLDFEGVDWVVQADCPENPQEYLHRVGRTARFNADGKGLLLILPSEVKIIDQLKDFKIPIKLRQIDRKTIDEKPITPSLEALLVQHADLRQMAEAVVKHYLKSAALQPNKSVFNVKEIQVEQFARSLGLQSIPKVLWRSKNSAHVEFVEQQNSENGKEKIDFEDEESEDDFLQLAKQIQPDQLEHEQLVGSNERYNNDNGDEIQLPRKKKRKKLKIDSKSGTGSKTVFDDEGDVKNPLELFAENANDKIDVSANDVKSRFDIIKQQMKRQDLEDKQLYKQKRRQVKIEKIQKLKSQQELNSNDEDQNQTRVVLGDPDRSSDDDENEDSEDSNLRAEVAHFGMGNNNQISNKNKFDEVAIKKYEVDQLSVADQEQLALQLLMQ